MSDGNNKTRRFASCRNVQKTIRFNQIALATDAYCHRDNEKLKPEKLEDLAASLAQEGQQTPLIVVQGKGDQFRLIAGHRRYYALKKASEDQLPGCSLDMEVLVTVMEQGEGQSEKDFEEDVLVRSVSDNENRIKFDDNEKLRIAKLLRERGVDAKRGMAALGVKDSQYTRYMHIVSTDWLYEAVHSGELKGTNAARLVEEAKKCDDATDRSKVRNSNVNRMELLKAGFDEWVEEAKKQLYEDNRWRAANNKSPLEGRLAYLSRYFTNNLLLRWVKCLTEGVPFVTGHPSGFEFLVNVDPKKLSLEIPKVSLKSDDLSEEKLESIIGGLEDGLTTVAQLLVEVQRREPISRTEAEAALARVREKRQGLEVQEPDDVGVPQTVDVAKAIGEQRSRQEDAETEEVDD